MAAVQAERRSGAAPHIWGAAVEQQIKRLRTARDDLFAYRYTPPHQARLSRARGSNTEAHFLLVAIRNGWRCRGDPRAPQSRELTDALADFRKHCPQRRICATTPPTSTSTNSATESTSATERSSRTAGSGCGVGADDPRTAPLTGGSVTSSLILRAPPTQPSTSHTRQARLGSKASRKQSTPRPTLPRPRPLSPRPPRRIAFGTSAVLRPALKQRPCEKRSARTTRRSPGGFRLGGFGVPAGHPAASRVTLAEHAAGRARPRLGWRASGRA